jgi:hypothetical protein
MNTRIHTDIWISRIVLVLGLILAASVAGVLILMITNQSSSEIFVALGFVAIGGLSRLLISPLNSGLLG